MSELRSAVLAAVATRIDALPRPALVGVDGVTAAGKTTFAAELVALVSPPAVRISVDDFHRPEAERHARGRGPESYYHDTFDLPGVREAMVKHWWRFFPLWYHEQALASRDAGLWRQEELVNAAYALVGTLAGVNRLYFARFEFKRQRAFLEKLSVAPARFADRLESLFALPPADAIAELGALVLETQAIVQRELPGIDVTLRSPPGGAQVEPWG